MSTSHVRKPKVSQRARCSLAGKFYYSSKKQALTRAAKAERWEGFEINVYKCEYCRGWHLTKNKDNGGALRTVVLGSDLFDFNWKVFADAFAKNINTFLDRHGV